MINLDEYQYNVLTSTDKDIIVLAGAGAGKTLTLLSKINRIVNTEDIDSSNILVLTFTRVAALNLRDRYLSMRQNESQSDVLFCTFHSFCYDVLTDVDVLHRLGYNSIPDIIDSPEDKYYIKRAIDFSSCKLSPKTIQNARQRKIDLQGKNLFEYENVIDIYNALLHQDNVIDYTSLCNSVCLLFSNNDDSIQSIKARYKYIFVDEFQDTDEFQFSFIKSMNTCHRILVGDPLQNIYQFRGCSNEPMKELMNSDSWTKFELPHNYRSTYQICNYVNNLSSKFKSKDYRVELISDIQGPEVIEITYKDNTTLASNIISTINSVSYSQSIAILCRTNHEVNTYCQLLQDRDINYSRRNTEYLADLLNFILCDSDDRYALLIKHMSECDYFAYKGYAEEGISDKDIFESTKFISILTLVNDIRKIESILHIKDIDQKTFMLCSMFNVDISNYAENNEELISYILNKIQSPDESRIYIGTIHSAKGLEFESVLIPGIGEQQFKINSEETENLLYTACTRAKKNLILFKYI